MEKLPPPGSARCRHPGPTARRGSPCRHDVQTDEIAAAGPGPGRPPVFTQPFGQHAVHGSKLRLQDLAMSRHVPAYPVSVDEELGVSQVVDLGRADGSLGEVAGVPRDDLG